MAAIAREREAAQRARRGLCRQRAARAAQRDRQASRGMGSERGRHGGDRRRGRAHLSAGAAARACSPSKASDPTALHAFALPRRRSALSARAPLLRLAGGAERAGRSAERSSRGARRLQRSARARDIRGGARRACRRRRWRSLAPASTPKQKKLKRRAHVEFERLFAETPSAFAARIAAYLAHPVTEPEVAPRMAEGGFGGVRVVPGSAPACRSGRK